MKKVIAVLSALLILLTLSSCGKKTENDTETTAATETTAEATTEMTEIETIASVENAGEMTVLVAYFTAGIDGIDDTAEKIAAVTGGTVFEITATGDYENATGLAESEIENNIHPEITARVENMSSYNAVFIGFPAVNGKMPMAAVSFMEEYDLRDKVIIPFVYNNSDSDLSAVTQKIDSVSFGTSQTVMLEFTNETTENEINTWLTGLGF